MTDNINLTIYLTCKTLVDWKRDQRTSKWLLLIYKVSHKSVVSY